IELPEIRIDPLSGHKTIIAGERSLRPGAEPRSAPPEQIDPASDPFAEGHEDRTPPEIYAERPAGGPANSPGWTVRVVPNLYPALAPATEGEGVEADPEGGTWPDLFASAPASGAHELIVNGPQPVLSLAELPVEQVIAALEVWRERMRAHADSAYVQLIVNERRE